MPVVIDGVSVHRNREKRHRRHVVDGTVKRLSVECLSDVPNCVFVREWDLAVAEAPFGVTNLDGTGGLKPKPEGTTAE
jgi:hypothetical protein